MALFAGALAAAEPPFFVLYVHGPGGVGKTALLAQFAHLAQAAGVTAVTLDARNLEPTAAAFQGNLSLALGIDPGQSPIEALTQRTGRAVILVDTYELMAPLDDWLRNVFLPQLPDQVLTVLAARHPPAPAWRADPGWQPLLHTLPLRNLSPQEGRAYLAQREGIERAAFTARDAAAGVAELQARGIAATGPVDFGRPVTLPDGTETMARFSTFNWPIEERPGDMRIFACQHHTRGAVWIPQLQQHANTATGIARVELLSRDPLAAARHMGRLIDREPQAQPDGAWCVPSGSSRAVFVFLSRPVLAARYPGVDVASLPDEGAAALVLRVADSARAREALARVPVSACGDKWVVPASHANGLMLVLVPA